MLVTPQDIVFMSLRWTITGFILWHFGLVYGFIICTALHFMNTQVMWHVFGLESLNPIDELFLYDDEKNISNILCKHHNTQII